MADSSPRRTPYLSSTPAMKRVATEGASGLCVLVAVGITPEGSGSILGVSVSLSEAEVHWRRVPGVAAGPRPVRRAVSSSATTTPG